MPAAAARRADARERRAQVALDVVVERLERRDVEHAQALARLRHEAVEEPQEGGERLARARRRAHEHVLARRDRRPAQRLSGRRRAERALEPAPCVRREAGERVSGGGGHRRCTIRPRPSRRHRSRRSNESSPLAVTTMAARERDARRDDAVARPRRPLARAQQRAQRAGRPARRAASDRGGVGVRGPDEQRRDGPDGDVLRAARPQREPGEHERGEPAARAAPCPRTRRTRRRDGERDRDDVERAAWLDGSRDEACASRALVSGVAGRQCQVALAASATWPPRSYALRRRYAAARAAARRRGSRRRRRGGRSRTGRRGRAGARRLRACRESG